MRRGCRSLSCSTGGAGWILDDIVASLSSLPRQRLRADLTNRSASVLVPLCTDVNGEPAVLFCVRAPKLRAHAGEICFPGGSADPGDADATATALREAYEEVGVNPANVHVLGQMHSVLSRNRLAVTPIVGYISDPGGNNRVSVASLKLHTAEVAAAFTLPLRQLLDPRMLTWYDVAVPRETMPKKVPAFLLTPLQAEKLPNAVDQERPQGAPMTEVSIWGLTGFVLHTFLFDVLKLKSVR